MTYFKKIAERGKYQDDQAIPDVINYITRADKAPSGEIYGVKVDMQNIANSMIAVSIQNGKNSGIRLHHFVLSFAPKDASKLPQVMREICDYIGRAYQIVAARHEDTPNPHIHFVFNAVSFANGRKYHGGKDDYYDLVDRIRDILSSHGIYPLVHVNYRPNPNQPHE